MLAGYRELAPLPEDHMAEARILWRHLQISLYLLSHPPQPGLSWAERPTGMFIELCASSWTRRENASGICVRERCRR
jgi:hypothetical protein